MTETIVSELEPMQISPELAERVQAELGENVYLCYQCAKCSSGCPVGEFFDWQPHQVMRALQLGQEQVALESDTPWLCASCQTCTTRCPQGLDISAIMDFLTREALARGIEPRVPEVQAFHRAFLREIRLWRRSYEPGLIAEMKLRLPEHLWDDLDLYLKMLRKGKVNLLPEIARPPTSAKPSSAAVDGIAYYPGCSLHSTAPEFDASTRAVCRALDLTLVEPDNWVCCGSSAAHRSDPGQSHLLPMTNLALIEQLGFSEVTMPCAACFNRHKAALFETRREEEARAAVEDRLAYAYRDRVQVNTLIDTLQQRAGLDRISAQVRRPLTGLSVVCYYGCLLTRPPEVTGASHPENPTNMDVLVEALGAEVLDWSFKTRCCGAAHSVTRPDIVLKLSGDLVGHAREAGADAIVVACPLCHTNLDARQFQMELEQPLPVLYFTQLMALAFDLPPNETSLHRNLVDPRPLLRKRGLLADGPPQRAAAAPIPADGSEAEAEEEPAATRTLPRAPPARSRGRPAGPPAHQDVFDLLERIWNQVSQRYDVIAERPSFQRLFDGADLDPPDLAAEIVVANMLMEVMERVDRFSPWYNDPARSYGLVSRRRAGSLLLVWGLSDEGRRRWRPLIDSLAGAIHKDRGLVLASLALEKYADKGAARSGQVEAVCACSPPRRLRMPAHYVSQGRVICEECRAAFRRPEGGAGESQDLPSPSS